MLHAPAVSRVAFAGFFSGDRQQEHEGAFVASHTCTAAALGSCKSVVNKSLRLGVSILALLIDLLTNDAMTSTVQVCDARDAQ
jgi:hypothetical protein